MKKIMILACCLLFGMGSYGQYVENAALDSLMALKKNPAALNKKLKSLGAGTEADLALLLDYYGRSGTSADSVMKIAFKRFPKGKLVFSEKVSRLYDEQDPFVQEKLIARLQQDFPAENYHRMNFLIAHNFAQSKQIEKSITYLGKIKGETRFMALVSVIKSISEYDQEVAEKLVTTELEKPNTEKEYIVLLNLYSPIMEKKEAYSTALNAIKKYAPSIYAQDPELAGNYYYMLSKTGDYAAALPGLESVVVNGNKSKRILEELKNAYLHLNPNKNVDEYLADVTKKVGWQFREAIAKKMIRKVAPDFSVRDVKGNVVSFAEFRGKTVVIDFWATWCGPCKRSLPAMQLLVNKYKENEEVKFLFIHTWEKVPDATEDATAYFSDNGYNLPLYMDLKDAVSKTNKAVSSFQVNGIPAKFVIDKNGYIRFGTSGSGPSTEAEVKELSAMIDITIAEK